MKTFKCQKWQSPNSSCLQWAPAAFLQVSFWSEPLRVPGPGKAGDGEKLGHVTAFSLLQRVGAQLQDSPDAQVLCSWGPLSPLINGLYFIIRVLCCGSTFFVNPHTTNSPKRAERKKERIQEYISYNGAEHLQFSSQYKTIRRDSVSSYTKLLLFLCYHF